MHSWEDIEENRCFSNGGTNLHIHAIAQGRPEDNQVKFLQGPHGIVNPPKTFAGSPKWQMDYHNSLPTRARRFLWCLLFLGFLSRVRHRANDNNCAPLACSIHN